MHKSYSVDVPVIEDLIPRKRHVQNLGMTSRELELIKLLLPGQTRELRKLRL